MNQQPVIIHTSDQKILSIHSSSHRIELAIQDREKLEKYQGNYTYENLPIEFKVIFENVEELYRFIVMGKEQEIKIDEKILVMSVDILGKRREFKLPLKEAELTGQLKLKKEIKEMELKLENMCIEEFHLREDLNAHKATIQELKKTVEDLLFKLNETQTQNLKYMNKIRQLQNNIQDLLNQKQRSPQNHLHQSKLTEQYTPIKKIYLGTKSKKTKELQQYGKKISFKIDDSAKHINKFKISLNDVQKLRGPTYQLFHYQPLPKQGRFYFDVKIILIKNNNIVVGIITEKNKDDQFSFKRMNSVCYNGYDGSICEQDKQSYVIIKPKEGNKLRTVVDMTLGQIQWFIIGGEAGKILIGKANIPISMLKQQLYPYFELYWQGNKIKLNC